MSDKLVKVAAYSIPVEAHAARGLLEAEGIRAVLEGEGAVNVFSGVQGLGGKITLNVAESDAERAVALLADVVDGPPPDDSRLWLCPLCGDAVDVDKPACPACATPRPETWQVRSALSSPRFNSDSQEIQSEAPPGRSTVTSDTPIEAVPWAREEEEERPARGTPGPRQPPPPQRRPGPCCVAGRRVRLGPRSPGRAGGGVPARVGTLRAPTNGRGCSGRRAPGRSRAVPGRSRGDTGRRRGCGRRVRSGRRSRRRPSVCRRRRPAPWGGT